MNDVLRYWRTLAVDYQAKRWKEEDEPSWGLRYLKLLISRKLAFAGLLIPLLLCEQAKVDYLVEQFEIPSLARITQLYRHDQSLHGPLRAILEIAEEFAKALADEGFRNEAKKVVAPSDKETWPPRFREMRRRADDLQNRLEEVFFDSRILRTKSRRYLSF